MMSEASDFLNSIFLGEVSNVHNYGAFVKIPGKKEQGMVHRSQMSNSPVEDASDVLQKGDRVWCKVIGVTDDGKISLSMKVVQQGTGKDLDPTGVQIHQDELKRKERPNQNRKKAIYLEAIFDTTCKKCGTKGHLAKDCFQTPDGKTYELIPEDEDDNINIKESITTTTVTDLLITKREKKKKKKEKKSKRKEKRKKEKKKSKKKRKHSSSKDSESENSDSSDERSSKKRRLEEVSRLYKK